MTSQTYPAKQHLLKTAKNLGADTGVIFVRGGDILTHPDSDTEYEFHQDSNFYYLTGVKEPAFAAALDIASGTAILFVNSVSADEAVWIGVPPSLDDYRATHGFDQAHYTADIASVIAELNPAQIYVLPHHSTTQLGKLLLASVPVDTEKLITAVHEARVFKDDHEIAVMRKANQISGDAHVQLMHKARVGMNEAELRGQFVGLVLSQGCDYEAYGSITARGRNAAILHYTKNNMQLDSDQDMILVDAGGTLKNYASDITRTWPLGAKFSPKCRDIYQIVLDMQKAVIAACVPHKQWEDMHILSNRVAAEGLLKVGILKGDIDSIMKNFVVGYFMPHGIGHLIGIDTHDVGGYPTGTERINVPGLRYLRARREMLPRMAFTVEPGLYFVDAILADAKANPDVAKHIDFDMVAKYRSVGGVRIEDNIVITETGNDNLTSCPKEIAEIESIRASAYA
ncbi:hypothetical protein GGI25_003429 [Coemansia spiralis]|uniref:Aminopeptidase P N-terminal domain-containing protein n=2 Tax=Coemansia TaxID=4863 RepID=A0A9W8KYD3_9FUNG|nr:peptidase M24, structural domain-containing protein [Coemansia spiralis]KAJ1994245.1 hypothetical protein EDC05_001687 [Coemansia umbellata]KAJ2621237.1 hypothetical protein GGI26_004310 [Coemansia sp. RSA 1358]KAJ2676784.1 hypothetical protein GGI25_003429 [Coemansia spiralis]